MVLTTLPSFSPSFHFIVIISSSFLLSLRTQSFVSQRDRALFYHPSTLLTQDLFTISRVPSGSHSHFTHFFTFIEFSSLRSLLAQYYL